MNTHVHALCFIRHAGLRGIDTLLLLQVTAKDACSRESALAALERGCTAWVRTSDAGRAAWNGSDHDFNVGDLGNWLGDSELRTALQNAGIEDVALLYQLGEGEEIAFDRVLVARDEAEEGDEEES